MTSFSRTHPQLFGFAVTFAGVAFFFPDALVIRLVEVDTMTVAVWRGLFAGLVTLIGLALFAPSAFRDWRILVSGPGAAIMLLQGIGSVFFLGSIGATSAANALLILASAPFLSALISGYFLKERLSPATWGAIVAVFAGVAIIASGSLRGGGLFGDGLALCNALTIALYYIVLRAAPGRNLLLPIAVGYLLTSLIALPFAPLPPLDLRQWGLLALSGGVILSGGGGAVGDRAAVSARGRGDLDHDAGSRDRSFVGLVGTWRSARARQFDRRRSDRGGHRPARGDPPARGVTSGLILRAGSGQMAHSMRKTHEAD